ncbi:MAG: hypothetical protein E6230_23130 [Paenibacillus dendritiformis]|uniref:hypothetical protein n=1 Tax=Paenibacillus dendritiformis TaxID=130049 RepID=UPI00143D992E|nr:hypothetical protein [Paenibacillus dendritiformis]MDU5145071.1 hypothetical protein [Paenibacillus dendritiformis]NKI22402.1 hypothetical protein [Paenibacillus dendritiformis]NRF99144.1 hypothetical protein [Paenibacillus dendritiformis]GIO73064.1 hypothetical protein J27TS7_25780 [Paenibacillus dendritiformis]
MKLKANEKELQRYFEGMAQLMKQVVKESGTVDELQGDKLVQALRTAIREEIDNEGKRSPDSPLKPLLERYVHRQVELTSFGGTIQGMINEVGEDYAEIRESDGSIVLVHLTQVISFQSQ